MPHEGLAVITGASSGIGEALAKRLAGEGRQVLAVARRAGPLAALAQENDRIQPCAADVAEPAGRAAIADATGNNPVALLVHNAGVLEPVGPLVEQQTEALRHALSINLEAPIALTQALLPQMPVGARVLHISSGAAHRALPGWGAYCISKAGLHMAYQILRQELAGHGIAVGSLRPGVVDTPMQALIRAQNEHDFPAVDRFRALKEMGELTSAEAAAEFIDAVLSIPDDGRFSAEEWDIREHSPVRY